VAEPVAWCECGNPPSAEILHRYNPFLKLWVENPLGELRFPVIEALLAIAAQ
jgi:hypothetical protein